MPLSFSGVAGEPARRLCRWLVLGVLLFIFLSGLPAATLTVKTNIIGVTPLILGYNCGHFYPGSNTREWWRYSGVNGARVFINAGDIEPTAGTTGSGVTSYSTYTNRLAAVRANPTSGVYIGWSTFTNNYANTLSGNNNIKPVYMLAALRSLGVQTVVCITCDSNAFSLGGTNDWANKWKIWRHYYAQAFYLSRDYGVQRFQMFNEPNYGTPPAISAADYFPRLETASDAIQSAVADVNRIYGKTLVPLVLGPVTTGSADGSYPGYGDLVVTNRHVNQFGVTDPNLDLIQKYDYHQYDASPAGFGTSLANLHTLLTNAMTPENAFPVTASEFNVYAAATYDTKTTTLDSPSDYSRFGGLVAYLVQKLPDELYCFKFSQTINSSSGNPTKNGMHYVDNNNSPYNIGGITQAGEVWRLFNKGLAAGRNRFAYQADSGTANLAVHASYDPVAQRYYIFSQNGAASPVTWSADLTAWGIPTNNVVLVEEVSEGCYGAGVLLTNIGSASLVGGTQPAYAAWLFTIPVPAQRALAAVAVTDDAMVADGANTNVNYGAATNLVVRNNSTNRAYRSVGLLKFHLPAGFSATNLQLAVLSLHAASLNGATNVQAHVYGIAGTNWTQATVRWTNAPNLKQGVAAGTNFANNFVLGVGDWTNSTVPTAGSARLMGQVVAGNAYAEQLVDVTGFLQGQTNADVSFLLAREVRFAGDKQDGDGLSIISSEGDSNSCPRLKLAFAAPPAPVITGFSLLSGTNITLNYSSQPGQDYYIQRAANLAVGGWLGVGTNTATSNVSVFVETPPGGGNWYYRVLTP